MANRNQGHNQDGSPRRGTSNRGFASMDAAQQREIARMGGAAVSGNREHMAQIGRKGGEASAESRANVRSAKARGAPESERTPAASPARDPQTTTTTLRSLGARSREDDLGQRSLGARSRDDDAGNRSLGARGRDDDTANRSLSGRSRDDDNGNRALSGRTRDDDTGTRSLGGRSREADADDGGGSRGTRGNAVGSPRNRDDDH
jgi:general stress protein YciG